MRGLRLQLASLFLLAVLPGLVATACYNYFDYRDTRTAEAARLLSRARLISVMNGVVLDGTNTLLGDLAKRSEIRDAETAPAACTPILDEVATIHPEFVQLAIFTPSGDVICSRSGARVGSNQSGRPWFAHVIATRNFAIGTYHPARGGKGVIAAGYPIVSGDGTILGVIGLGIDIGWVANRFAQLALENGVVLTLFDGDGTALARYPDPDHLTGRTLQSVATRISAGSDGLDETEFLDGTTRIAAFAPLGGKDWHDLTVSIDIDPGTLLASARWNLTLDLSSLFSVVLVGAFVAFFWGGKLFIAPVAAIGNVATRLSAGEMDARVGGPYRDNEMGRVARAVDDMAKALCLRDHELRRANDYKSRVLAIAGHDLRQPLQVISMSHELIGRAIGNPKLQLQLARADDAVERLLRQLDLITSAGRLEEGALAPAIAPVALGTALAEAAAEHASLAEAKGLRLTVAATSAVAFTDREMLATILRNLIGNAVKYTKRGRILVGCRRHGGDIAIDVYDTGIGIPEDQLANVFDDFLQLDPRSAGMGLGLAIVKRTADLLGHPLEVRSAVDRGTRFRLVLPRSAERPPRLQLRSA
jgi:signal transduction histidine kinase